MCHVALLRQDKHAGSHVDQLLANAGVIVGNSRLVIAVLVINLSSMLVNHSRTSAAESWPWKFPVNLFLSEARKMAIS